MGKKKLLEVAEIERKYKPKLQKYWTYKSIHKDPYDPRYYVSVELFVPIPDRNNPFPCVLVNIYNSGGRVFFRILDLKELTFFGAISPEETENCCMALKLANNEAKKILEANRELEYRNRMPEGMKIAYYNEKTKQSFNPETGEILKESAIIYKA